MATKLQKLIQEIESQKMKLQSLRLGEQDEQIIQAGIYCLRSLLKLHSQFKTQPSQQVIIEENFIGVYAYLLQVAHIYDFSQFEELVNSQVVKIFGNRLKDLHYSYAVQAQKQNNSLMLEYHLRLAVKLVPNDETLCQNLSQYYMDNSDLTNAYFALQHYLGPFSAQIFYQRLYCLNKMCDFEAIEKEIPKICALIEEGNTDVILLFLKWIGIDNPTVLQASKNYQKPYEGKQDYVFRGTKDKQRKLRLAYIGSNFLSHAQATQFGSTFFSNHDSHFEIYVYSLKGEGSSEKEKQIKEQVHVYRTLAGIDNEKAIEMIRNDEIDIIVNGNGHADDRRPYVILSHRVAPIQIDYLGYPGTSGSTYIDYYVGDVTSTPIEKLGPYFTEKLILMPHTYQVTEHLTAYPGLPAEKPSFAKARQTLKELLLSQPAYQQEVFDSTKKSLIDEFRQIYEEVYTGKTPLTSFDHQVQWLAQNLMKKKKEHGKYFLQLNHCMFQYQQLLQVVQKDEKAIENMYENYLDKLLPPEEFVQGRFIYCSLNHHVKLSRKDVTYWNQILCKVPDSILIVFLMFSHTPQANLLHFFDPAVRDRIYFVGAASKWLHLHRLQGIDCILDSFYYGAHTSAGDAIWSLVPIISCLGKSMESRVCSSMLYAAGLNPLVCNNEEEYLQCAVKCATDHDFYQSCLEKLQCARQSPLFDQKLYVRHLTNGYQQAWENFCEEKPFDHILIK